MSLLCLVIKHEILRFSPSTTPTWKVGSNTTTFIVNPSWKESWGLFFFYEKDICASGDVSGLQWLGKQDLIDRGF